MGNCKHFAFLSICLIVSACGTFNTIDKIPNIIDINVELINITNNQYTKVESTSLEPGNTYHIGIKYFVKYRENLNWVEEWRDLGNYEGILITSDSNHFLVENRHLKVNPDSFFYLLQEQAALTIVFPPKTGKTIEMPLSLAQNSNTSLPSFAGTDGDNRVLFDKNGRKIARFTADGAHIYSTGPGLDGLDGQTLELDIAQYDVEGTVWEANSPFWLVHERRSGSTWLLNLKNNKLLVDASGGDGSRGGRGENRKASESQKRVKGGDGYPGGRGGRGGDVWIFLATESQLRSRIEVDIRGGQGGAGGEGGQGEDPEQNVLDVLFNSTKGNTGPEGPSGPPGRVYYETLALDAMFLSITSPLFERKRLLP